MKVQKTNSITFVGTTNHKGRIFAISSTLWIKASLAIASSHPGNENGSNYNPSDSVFHSGIHRALFDLNLIVVVVFFSFHFFFFLFSLAVNMFGQVIYSYIFHSYLHRCLFAQ